MKMSLTHIISKNSSAYNSFDNTQPTFHTHLNDLEVHLWRYLFNGHTASHVCLTHLQGIEVECIVNVCCIYHKCSVCFVVTKLNTQQQSA